MNIDIHDGYIKELNYLIELQKQCGTTGRFDRVEDLVNFIVHCIAEGSRRPGAWERQLLYPMGLVADCEEHERYRGHYGKPEE